MTFNSFLLLPYLCVSSFEESILSDPSYIIQIHSAETTFEHDNHQLVVMKTATGVPYDCYVPNSTTKEKHDKGEGLTNENLLEFGRMATKDITSCFIWTMNESSKAPAKEPLIGVGADEAQTASLDGAAVRTEKKIIESSMQYEICLNSVIRQVKITGESREIIVLGEFAGDSLEGAAPYQEYRPTEFADQIKKTSTYAPLYSHRYGRKNMVQFLCGNKDEVIGFQYEKKTGEYAFLLASPSFCAKTKESSDIKTLLSPLSANKVCIKKNEGWWTYELCFGSKIRQFHMEQSGEITIDFSLGEYDTKVNEEMEKKGSSFTAEYLDGTHEHARVAYATEYASGTRCAETSDRRKTRMLMYCNPASTRHVILSVKEVATCSYEMKVATSIVCTHPNFARDNLHPNDNTQAVHCTPQIQEAKTE